MGLDQETFDAMAGIERLLKYPASFDHYCEDDACDIDNPHCGEMHTARALREVQALLEPRHIGAQQQRLQTGDPEKIYAEQWKSDNERLPHVNSGFTLLEWILCDKPPSQGGPFHSGPYPDRVTQRDAFVAASVIQWLGTSCGLSFMQKCERLVEQRKAIRRQVEQFQSYNAEPPADVLDAAMMVADRHMRHDTKQHGLLKRDVSGAIEHVVKQRLVAMLAAGGIKLENS